MRDFLKGRISLVEELRSSSTHATDHDLLLILTAVISACAAWRWPSERGERIDRKRFVETLIQFSPPSFHTDFISVGALLEAELISEAETPWKGFGNRTRILTGDDVDLSLADTAARFPKLAILDLKKASYANLIYEWLRCGYAHTYWAAGNTTSFPPSHLPAQVSYIGRQYPDGKFVRVACFHLDYLIDLARQQVACLPDASGERPNEWWVAKSDL